MGGFFDTGVTNPTFRIDESYMMGSPEPVIPKALQFQIDATGTSFKVCVIVPDHLEVHRCARAFLNQYKNAIQVAEPKTIPDSAVGFETIMNTAFIDNMIETRLRIIKEQNKAAADKQKAKLQRTRNEEKNNR